MTDIKGLAERLKQRAANIDALMDEIQGTEGSPYDVFRKELREAATFLTCLAELGEELETTAKQRAFIRSVVKPGGSMGWKEVDDLLNDFARLLLANATLTERIASLEAGLRNVLLNLEYFVGLEPTNGRAWKRADSARRVLENARALLNPGPGDTTNG